MVAILATTEPIIEELNEEDEEEQLYNDDFDELG
jgi:hypothetical protein